MTVKILKFTEKDGYVSFREDFKFTYKEKMLEFMKEVMASEKNRIAALGGLWKGLLSVSAGSDDFNAFRLPEAGKFNKIFFIFFILFICLARFSFDLGL